MKATVSRLVALLVVILAAPCAQANPFYPGNPYCGGIPQAPDACGPGYYSANCCGAVYGPNYWLRPPFPPYGGMPPCLSRPEVNFPTHPYARGPRDFFMLESNPAR